MENRDYQQEVTNIWKDFFDSSPRQYLEYVLDQYNDAIAKTAAWGKKIAEESKAEEVKSEVAKNPVGRPRKIYSEN